MNSGCEPVLKRKPTLSEQEAIDPIDCHRDRNDVAHESHHKTWLAKP
jgi:hypothetical protein